MGAEMAGAKGKSKIGKKRKQGEGDEKESEPKEGRITRSE